MSYRRVLLVVEDDPDIRRLVMAKFSPQPDFIVEGEATNASDAIVLAGSIGPDLIVLDNRLEGEMSGMAAAALLREAAPGCRIILFSASEELREAALSSGDIDAFVMKTDVRTLVDRARDVLPESA